MGSNSKSVGANTVGANSIGGERGAIRWCHFRDEHNSDQCLQRCFGLWVNFTRRTSAANPLPHNYMLLKNESEVSFSTTSTWIEKISPRKTVVYSCVAYQLVDNITSTNNVTVTGNGNIGIFFRCNVITVMFKQLSDANHSVSVALHLRLHSLAWWG